MHLARCIVSRSCKLSLCRTAPQTTARFFSLSHCNLATSLKKAKKDASHTQLEAKIHKLEMSVLSTPSNSSRSTSDDTAQRHNADAAANAAMVLNKRPLRKKRNHNAIEELSKLGFFNVSAFATAEQYDLEALLNALTTQNLYETKRFFSTDNLGVEQDVLYVTAKYKLGPEARDIFFFREGSMVLWNFNEIETNNVLSFVRPFEKDGYLSALIRGESEVMPYTYIPESAIDVEGDLVRDADTGCAHGFFQNGKFFITSGDDNFLQKYTFSNAMATTTKLGIWEATLDRYIDSMGYLTEDLKRGRRIRISRPDVLRKTGELFALRHVINLSSDLLDTPDFYWDRETLEALYLQICAYFSVSRRTKVMNEKINHCVELAELISHNLNDAHHIRLEWMIIILIMVEVAFEIVHYTDRFYNKEHEQETETELVSAVEILQQQNLEPAVTPPVRQSLAL